MEIEKLEAAVEAILFTMGESVELGRIAKAIEQDTETTRKLIRNLMLKYKNRDRGSRSLNWEILFRCVRNRNTMIIWYGSPCSQKSRVLTDVMMENALYHCLQTAGDKDGDREDPGGKM